MPDFRRLTWAFVGYHNGTELPTGRFPWPHPAWYRETGPAPPSFPQHFPAKREVCHEEVPVVLCWFWFPCCSWSSSLSQAQADVTLPKVIGSHMVLQRDRPLPIWGWAAPGEEVTVKLDEATATAKADAQGNWKVVLPAVKADGKAHRMTVSGKNKIELEDILIGDVWLGSGQSNMEMGIDGVREGQGGDRRRQLPADPPAAGAQGAGRPAGQGRRIAEWVEPARRRPWSTGGWGGFSAALYYFGQRLHKELDVPVGLIDSSWGGSPIEPWIVAGEKRRRHVQRHDRPREALCHPRRDLVSGRVQRWATA